MGKLYYQSRVFHNGEEVVGRTIIDILTTNKTRTSVWAPKKPGRLISDIIGINSVSQGSPVRLKNGFYERGFINPEAEDTLYLINPERRVLGMMPNKIYLFYDQDKVSGENMYIWEGTFQEIIDEFQKARYIIEKI